MRVQKRVVSSLRRIAEVILVAILVLSGTLLPIAKVFAGSGVTINAPTTLSGQPGQAVNVSGVSITASGNPTEPVHLQVLHGTLSVSVTTGLTFTTPASGPYSGSVLEFSGTVTNINAALATLQYTANDLAADTLDISLTDPGQVYDPTNSHIYQYVSVPGGIDWTDAKAAADASTVDGLTGYLATLTSADENSFVANRIQSDAWIGASDLAVDYTWRWVDGPESGTQFFAENPLPSYGGTTVNGEYANWNPGEPNDGSGNGREDCAEYYSSPSELGFWNDLPCTDTAITGYLVEYGSDGNLPSVVSSSTSITNTGATVTPSDCTQLMALDDDPGSQYDNIVLNNNIDCTDLSVTPLFSDNTTFPNGFVGTFNGQGHTISGYDLTYSDDEAGLFAETDGATIENLHLTNGTINNDDNETGAVTGYADATTITNVTSSWTIDSSDDDGGGLVGYLENDDAETSTISNVSVTGNVTTDDGDAGGLVGYIYNDGGTLVISQASVTGNVDGNDEDVGGLIGEFENYAENDHDGDTTIEDVYVTGSVGDNINSYYVGGLIGEVEADGDSPYMANLTIERGYVSGAVESDEYSGGVIGGLDDADQYSPVVVRDMFIAGAVSPTTDPDYAGVLFGYNSGDQNYVTSTDNYFDQTNVGMTDCTGPGENLITGTCTGIDTTVQPNYFKGTHNRAPMNFWDFNTIWRTNTAAYPTFGVGDDNDGSAASVENAAPNGGDANNDGQQDSQESNVTSLVDGLTGKYAVLQSAGQCDDNSGVTVNPESSNIKADADYSYPLGLMDFTLTCAGPGESSTVTQFYYGSYIPSQYVLRKYDPAAETYSIVPGATFTAATIGGQSVMEVSYNVTDGSGLDEDGTVNGQIVDPAGPALRVVPGATSSLTDTGINVLIVSAASAALLAGAVAVYRRNTRPAKLYKSPPAR